MDGRGGGVGPDGPTPDYVTQPDGSHYQFALQFVVLVLVVRALVVGYLVYI